MMNLKSAKELVASVTEADIVSELDEFQSRFIENELLSLLIAGYEGVKPDRFLELYSYAFNGDLSQVTEDEDWFDDAICLCSMIDALFCMFDEISGFVATHDAIDVVHDAAFGRFRIDLARIAEVTGEENDYDGERQISLRQIAILCRMKEASIRNALSQDANAPVGRKVGKQVFFDSSQAHKWMLKRRGYQPTLLPEGADMLRKYRNGIKYDSAYIGGEEIDRSLDIS